MSRNHITLGNSNITARDITISKVSYSSEPRKYYVTIQYRIPQITENGIMSYTFENKTYKCTEDEYDRYSKELFNLEDEDE